MAKKYLDETGLSQVWSKMKSTFATPSDIATALGTVYKVKGSCTTAQLPTTDEDRKQGDVWNLSDAGTYGPAGTNVVWTGTDWDPLAGTYSAFNSTTAGLVPAPGTENTGKFLKGDGTWAEVSLDGYATQTWVENKGYLTSVTAHNQASNTITAMTGYSKPATTSAIATTDDLNTAIGKLEKALDSKGTSSLTLGTTHTTAAYGDHTHTDYVKSISVNNSTAVTPDEDGIANIEINTDVFTTTSNGLVPAPTAANLGKYLKSDGTWAEIDGIKTYENDPANRQKLNLARFNFSTVNSSDARFAGAMFLVTVRDNTDNNSSGILTVRYGAYSADNSSIRANYCNYAVLNSNKTQPSSVKFYVDTTDVNTPKLYCEFTKSGYNRVYITPVHNVKNFVWTQTEVTDIPTTNVLEVAQTTMSGGTSNNIQTNDLKPTCMWRTIYGSNSTGKWWKFGEIKKTTDYTGFACDITANSSNDYIQAKLSIGFRTTTEKPSDSNYTVLVANIVDYRFFSSNNSLSSFNYPLDLGYKFTDGYTCELYIRKGTDTNENFGHLNIYVSNIESNINGGGQPLDYTWVSEASNVSQLTEGTGVTAFSRKGIALAYDAVNAFSKKGGVSSTTDWNTLTEPGTYKVQCAGWGAAATYHSPNNYSATQYSYGLLNVFVSNVSDEKRIMQIYYPHGGPTTADRQILFRMHNSNDMTAGWGEWAPIFVNTWRGIQNNLTSDSTTDSLSAAQGKALNDKFGSYVAKAGDTMNTGATLTFPCDSDDRKTKITGEELSFLVRTSEGWADGVSWRTNDETTKIWQTGVYGSASTMRYAYNGTSYNTPTVKYKDGQVGIAGTLNIGIAKGTAESISGGCKMSYNSTDESLDFIF